MALTYPYCHDSSFSIAGAMVSSRTVDLRLERQSESDITFSALVKDEHPLISEFLESKRVKVSNQVMDDMMGTSQAVVRSWAPLLLNAV